MAPLAPIVTQIVPTDQPATAGTPVADLTQPVEETDPGPFTYATTSSDVSVSGTQLVAAMDLSTAISVDVTAESAAGVSSATTASLTFAPVDSTADDEAEYAGNPQFPPADDEPWTYFITRATQMLFPRAIEGTDFVVGRALVTDPIGSIYWNEDILGTRPDAEIEALAKELAAPAPPAGQTMAMGTSGQPAAAIPSKPPIALYAPLTPTE